MTHRDTSRRRKNRTPRPAPPPLDSAKLQELALAYVARFATTSAKLEAYLSRKLRERGWNRDDDGGGENLPDLGEISARFVDLGYIDEDAYARSRSRGLLGRGFGPRRVSQDLYAAGIDEQTRSEIAPGQAAIRRAAFELARKRRFGPFSAQEPDPERNRSRKQKQVAAMLRAGHGFETVKAIMGAASVAAAEEWVAEAQDAEAQDEEI
ncbi:regulatory protein RecX [Allopontixanthobacter sp.]|uniref:regulatory protein RecX n=1 Tax=Allopontixanthobacter sp. TaxID=2906452 RepID=UPI002ABB2949|nr:RecX family transcriptional regulator [Allopontixanthobacter sp.]MDZ4307300.1 RecX family transcriptional regulator [Allopontixanthobacter sp.]